MLYRNGNKRWEDQTATAQKYPQGYFNPKPCRRCNSVFTPKAPSNLYCSQECADYGVASAYLMRCYGIDYDNYVSMLGEQGNVCKLCGSEGFVMKGCHRLKLVVDHCHQTGRVRGLLCHNCNRALGLFQDDPKILKAAIGYLQAVKTISKGSSPKQAPARRLRKVGGLKK
jgi:hypothetical protein